MAPWNGPNELVSSGCYRTTPALAALSFRASISGPENRSQVQPRPREKAKKIQANATRPNRTRGLTQNRVHLWIYSVLAKG